MKKFLKEYGLWILFATAVIAVAMAAMSFFASTSSPLSNLAGTLSSPFRSAYSALANWIDEQQAYFADNKALLAENQALRNQIAEMERDFRLSKDDSEENARLRALLNLHQQRQDFVFEPADIVGRGSSNWSSTLTLNKGTINDIAVGDCVVNEEGFLVGVVTESGLNWSTVTTLVDTSSELGARVFRTGEVTVAQGELSLMNQNLLRLSYLEDASSLMNGDLIVTSGLGGFYPSDLVIGSVKEIRTDDTGLNRYAILAPQVDLSQLRQIFVITDFQVVD